MCWCLSIAWCITTALTSLSIKLLLILTYNSHFFINNNIWNESHNYKNKRPNMKWAHCEVHKTTKWIGWGFFSPQGGASPKWESLRVLKGWYWLESSICAKADRCFQWSLFNTAPLRERKLTKNFSNDWGHDSEVSAGQGLFKERWPTTTQQRDIWHWQRKKKNLKSISTINKFATNCHWPTRSQLILSAVLSASSCGHITDRRHPDTTSTVPLSKRSINSSPQRTSSQHSLSPPPTQQ